MFGGAVYIAFIILVITSLKVIDDLVSAQTRSEVVFQYTFF